MNYKLGSVTPDSTLWNRLISSRTAVEQIAMERAADFADSLEIALASQYCLMSIDQPASDMETSLFPGISVGGQWWSKHWSFIAHVVAGYSMHRGVQPKILWRADGPQLGCESGDHGAIVITNSAVLYAIDSHVTVIPAHVVPEPVWLPGATQGDAGIALNPSRTLLLGIGDVDNEHGEKLFGSWLIAAALSHVLPLGVEQADPQLSGRDSFFTRP